MTKTQWLIIGSLLAAILLVFCIGGVLLISRLTPSQTQVVFVEVTTTPPPTGETRPTSTTQLTARPTSTVMPSATLRPSPTNTPVIRQPPRTDIRYDSLARNTESYVGQSVYYRGRVEQVAEVNGLKVVLRVSVTQGDYGLWSDVVWVNYEGPRVLENDIVRLTGIVKGRREYTSIFGQSIVIPEIDAVSIQVEPKASATNTLPTR